MCIRDRFDINRSLLFHRVVLDHPILRCDREQTDGLWEENELFHNFFIVFNKNMFYML